MKIQQLFGSLVLAALLSVLLFAVALADEYTVPVIIDGETYSITVTAEGGRVISATSDISTVEIGAITLNVAPGSEVITDTNLADMIISNDFPSFPTGEPDEVSVVHTAIRTDSIGAGHLYVVVRNNTDEVIYNVRAEADLYSIDNDYLGTEDSLYRFQPSIVPPGGISASFVYFSGLELSEDDTYEIFTEYSNDPKSYASSFLEIIDPKKSERNSSIVGRIKNISDSTLTEVEVYVSCYDEATESIDYESGDVNVESLDPGETARFTVRANCDKYLLYSTGN